MILTIIFSNSVGFTIGNLPVFHDWAIDVNVIGQTLQDPAVADARERGQGDVRLDPDSR